MNIEFTNAHADEGAFTVSCDDANSYPLGIPVVTRYHRIRRYVRDYLHFRHTSYTNLSLCRFFGLGDEPDQLDHDFQSGYRVKNSGYLFLPLPCYGDAVSASFRAAVLRTTNAPFVQPEATPTSKLACL